MLSVHDTVSEWLRRWTRNPLGSARRGSNPLGVDVAVSVPQYVCVISYKHVSRQLCRCGPCFNNQRTQESATNRRNIMTRERERERERGEDILTAAVRRQTCIGGDGGGGGRTHTHTHANTRTHARTRTRTRTHTRAGKGKEKRRKEKERKGTPHTPPTPYPPPRRMYWSGAQKLRDRELHPGLPRDRRKY